MVLGLLSKVFGRSETAPADSTQLSDDDRLVEFVRFVVCELVDAPDKVAVGPVDKGNKLAIQITCEKPDIGKVIGKRGKTIAAIRALVAGAGRRSGREVMVDVLD
jgi:predicted RNA-binding protein YlqC (UPF0109 family)